MSPTITSGDNNDDDIDVYQLPLLIHELKGSIAILPRAVFYQSSTRNNVSAQVPMRIYQARLRPRDLVSSSLCSKIG